MGCSFRLVTTASYNVSHFGGFSDHDLLISHNRAHRHAQSVSGSDVQTTSALTSEVVRNWRVHVAETGVIADTGNDGVREQCS